MIPRRVDSHKPVSLMPLPRGPPSPPVSIVSSLYPFHTSMWQGGSCSERAMVHTCNTWYRKGGVGYPPTGPLSCPAGINDWSEHRGWSDLRTSTDIPIRGKSPLSPPWVRIPIRSGVLPGGGSGTLFQLCVVPGNGSQDILSQDTLRTRDSWPFGDFSPGMPRPPPSSDIHTPLLNFLQWRSKSGRPCLLYFCNFSADRPGQRAPSIPQNPIEVLICSSLRCPLFLHALSFECTSKLSHPIFSLF